MSALARLMRAQRLQRQIMEDLASRPKETEEARKLREAAAMRLRFWTYVQKSEDVRACWEWTGGKSRGYGSFSAGARGNIVATRMMWEITTGEIVPSGMYICHHCDNPPCVNPAHLFIGTPSDNARDRVRKGHHRGGRKKKNRDLPVPMDGRPGSARKVQAVL